MMKLDEKDFIARQTELLFEIHGRRTEAVAAPEAEARTRLRCMYEACAVAWTASNEDIGSFACWVCGEDGLAVRASYSLHEDDYLHLDLEYEARAPLQGMMLFPGWRS